MATEPRLYCTPAHRGASEVIGMTDTQIVELALQGMTIAAKMCAPILITALLIGFAISLFQSVTQIQEATLSFVPKAAGVGEDGHVASIFPGHPVGQATGATAAVHDSPKPPPTRITLTMPAIRSAEEVWLIASGEGKAEAVGAARAGKDLPAASAVGAAKTVWLLDRAAAGLS